MRIIYDDLIEAAEVAIRCDMIASKNKCMWCPLCVRCMMDQFETRSVLCGDIEPPKENDYVERH